MLFALGCVRLEAVFVGIGCAAAVLLATHRRFDAGEGSDSWTWWRRVLMAGSLAFVAAIPFLVNGVVDRVFGRQFLPNSIVLKTALRGHGVLPSWSGFLEHLNQDPLLGLLVLAAVLYLVFVAGGLPGRNTAYAVAFVVTAVLHVAFADIGWWERYQAYLVASGLLLVLLILQELVQARWREVALIGLSISMVLFSVGRLALLTSVPLGMSNTYRQQYQVGRFLDEEYSEQSVAVQDLGYAAYLHDGPVLDLFGLGSHDVLDRLRGRELNTDDLRTLVRDHKVKVIAIAASAFASRIPPEWVAVEQWDLGEARASTGYPEVTFYAPNADEAEVLERNLATFRSSLPPGVVVLDRAELVRRAFTRLADQG